MKCALRPSLDFDPKLRFQYSWDQFRLSKRKEDFSILHFLLSLCNPSKLLWDQECNGSSNTFSKAHFMLNPCTASTNQYSPILSLSLRELVVAQKFLSICQLFKTFSSHHICVQTLDSKVQRHFGIPSCQESDCQVLTAQKLQCIWHFSQTQRLL